MQTPGIQASQATHASQAKPKARRVWPALLLGLVLALAALLATAESTGWTFLAAPLQQTLARSLGRSVMLDQPMPGQAAGSGGLRIHLLGGLRLEGSRIEIGAPAWSKAPFLMRAQDAVIQLRYADLWRAYRGQRLTIQALQASRLDAYLERLPDGRSSWQLDAANSRGAASPPAPQFELLRVTAGTLHYRDALTGLDTRLELSLGDAGLLKLSAHGRYHALPLQAEMSASGVLPWINAKHEAKPVPVSLRATIGKAELQLQGSALDVLHLRGLNANFSLSGPSLAAVGDPLGVTLPTTAAFRAHGAIQQNGEVWQIQVAQARIGATLLNADLKFDPSRPTALLSGRLGGSRLALADLGPVLGTTAAIAAPAAVLAVSAPSTASAASEPAGIAAPGPLPAVLPAVLPTVLPASTRGRGHQLPNRPFDLAAMRKMDADVVIAIDLVDASPALLAPLRPLRAHLLLTQGLLSLQQLDAGMGGGRLRGSLQLDGRAELARWDARLNWQAVKLEDWLRLPRKGDAPPYLSGSLNGQANLLGQGRSTAEILASLNGRVRAELKGGSISHLVIEAAGLDLAESLGLLIKGDEPLIVQCAVADLQLRGGVLRPQVMVLDTIDSSIFIDGSLSLDQETFDLRAIVNPKDFSPLTLRSPLHLQGTFAKPEFALEKGRLGIKLAGAVLLGLLSPVAALLPLLDPGDTDAASQDRAGCERNLHPKGEGKAKPGDKAKG
jgi:uncharacterized protein involved in outer membrane biogenesis